MNKIKIRRSQEEAVVSFTSTNMLAVADLTCLKLPKAEKGRKLKLKIAREKENTNWNGKTHFLIDEMIVEMFLLSAFHPQRAFHDVLGDRRTCLNCAE